MLVVEVPATGSACAIDGERRSSENGRHPCCLVDVPVAFWPRIRQQVGPGWQVDVRGDEDQPPIDAPPARLDGDGESDPASRFRFLSRQRHVRGHQAR